MVQNERTKSRHEPIPYNSNTSPAIRRKNRGQPTTPAGVEQGSIYCGQSPVSTEGGAESGARVTSVPARQPYHRDNPHDAQLNHVIESWPLLSFQVRTAIVAIVSNLQALPQVGSDK